MNALPGNTIGPSFLRFANRSVVAKTSFDREIDKFGTPEQRLLPEDQGTGLIWRLCSITRLEEREGDVYAEL